MIHVWLFMWGALPLTTERLEAARAEGACQLSGFRRRHAVTALPARRPARATDILSPVARGRRGPALLARLLLGEVGVEPHEGVHDRDPDHDRSRADVDIDPRLDGGEDHERDHDQVDHAVDPASDEAERAERARSSRPR